MQQIATRLRARMAIALSLMLIAGALLAAQAKPADASTAARVPAAVFLQLADHLEAPSISGGWFAKYDGIDGEALDEDHNKWIDIISIDWGANKPGGAAVGATRRRGSAEVRDFVITFEYEKASPKVLEALLKGKVIPKLEIELTANFGEARATYLKYELKNVMVTSYDVGGSAIGSPPLVVVANNFEEIKVTYTEYDDTGQKAGNVETSWKRETGQ